MGDLLGSSTARLLEESELPPSRLPDRGPERTPLRLTALVPAHNEALTIAAALNSLHGQTRPPDNIVVVADNCTDRTAEIVRQHGRRSSSPLPTRTRKPARSIRRCHGCSTRSIPVT
jgi:cellulose synthase/poly-beta-1,6-N-acetylglucosamine synthase-like glycosyltransferase